MGPRPPAGPRQVDSVSVRFSADRGFLEEGIRPSTESVEAVRGHLADLDPAGAGACATNATAYAAELEALDAAFKETLAVIPPGRRQLVVAHDAYTYVELMEFNPESLRTHLGPG